MRWNHGDKMSQVWEQVYLGNSYLNQAKKLQEPLSFSIEKKFHFLAPAHNHHDHRMYTAQHQEK